MLELILFIGGRASWGEKDVALVRVFLASPVECSKSPEPEEPEAPESVVRTCGRSITRGSLKSRRASLSASEKRTARGDVSMLMTEENG